MIRTVLAVVVAVVLLATASPALSDAGHQTTRTELGTVAERLDRIATGLASDSTALADPTLAARTTVSIAVPSGFGSAPVERARIGCLRDDESAIDVGARSEETCRLLLAYRFTGGSTEAHAIPGATLAPATPPIELSTTGTTVQLRYVRRDGTSAVELLPIEPDQP
ncbi:DUF7311 family protein [Halopenitus persicus]|uniref:DUF7311 family protein n=1 Tax=Halopenitus persicus TaxID=1048396 RepID=UPI000BBA6FCF|nr:hypothetical protein [Halopenitus persicus]